MGRVRAFCSGYDLSCVEGLVIVIFCFLIVSVIFATSTCGWYMGPAANFLMVSLVVFGVYCDIDRASAL